MVLVMNLSVPGLDCAMKSEFGAVGTLINVAKLR